MKPRIASRFAAVVASCLFAAPVTCNSIFTKSPPVDTSDKPYEYVETVGTNIPQRVVKGQQPVLASPTSTLSAEAWRDAMERAQSHTNRGR